jgi:hypothetical protein
LSSPDGIAKRWSIAKRWLGDSTLWPVLRVHPLSIPRVQCPHVIVISSLMLFAVEVGGDLLLTRVSICIGIHKAIVQSRKRDVRTHCRPTPLRVSLNPRIPPSSSSSPIFHCAPSQAPQAQHASSKIDPSNPTPPLERISIIPNPPRMTLSVSLISSFRESACWIGIRRYVQMSRKKSPRSTPVGFGPYTSMFHGRRGWMRHIKGSGGSHAKRGESEGEGEGMESEVMKLGDRG